jgi:predicted RNase H-like nuclease (RuvC/YqgF family)
VTELLINTSLEWLNVKPLDIKAMMAMIKDEPEDKYIPVLKPVLMQALTEIKQLRRKNSQLGGKVARYRREKEELEDALAMYQ